MGKYEKKKKKKKAPVMAVILTMLVLAILVVFVLGVMPQLLYRLSGEEETVPTEETPVVSIETTAPTETTVMSVLEFPQVCENGWLTLDSLFQYDGINPDCGNQEGDNIASLLVKNTSETFLTDATIRVVLSDGTQTDFVVTNLPAGETAMAFSADNAELGDGVACIGMTCEAGWGNSGGQIPESVVTSVDGMTITVKNKTAQEIPELVVFCRAPFDEEYFGGKAYEYTVNNLPAYGSITIDALDSIMGVVEVVRVAVD